MAAPTAPPTSTAAGLIPPAALQALPAAVRHAAAQLRMQRLAGDGIDGTWLIEASDYRAVLRLRDPGRRIPAVDRHRELLAQERAAAAGLAPAVLAADPDAGWLLMEFVAAEPWSEQDFGNRERLLALGAQLRRLHALPPPAAAPFDAQAIARGQLALLGQAGATVEEEVLARAAELRDLQAEIQSLGSLALNHGDLAAANVLGARCCLIDWEYAQLTDPSYDLACLLEYHPQSQPHLEVLLHAAGQADAGARRRLAFQRRLFRVLQELWQAAQSAGRMRGSL